MKQLPILKSYFLGGVLLFFIILMVNITIPYIAFDDNVAFLRIKRTARTIPIWKAAFYIHVFTSTFLLLAGFTQFSKRILTKNKRLHRLMGKLYVVIILFLSGPSGLIMAVYANGGTISQIAFTLLSILWIGTTFLAYSTVRKRNYDAHERWMMRSFALTLSALTLRAWKYILVALFMPPPMDLYRLVAWLGWIPNLVLVEWWIRNKRSSTKNSR